MSKMSQLHAELTEQAAELGFQSIEEAEANGYHISYTDNKVKLTFDMSKACEEAHEAWLDQREQIITNLTTIKDKLETEGYDIYTDWLEETINFIKQGEI